jgi:protein-ribulosamine 3-kinase
MVNRSQLKLIFQDIFQEKIDKRILIKNISDLSGGCISKALKAETSSGIFFIKWNADADIKLFETEAKGLHLLKDTRAIDIPHVFTYGRAENFIYLILGFIDPASQKYNYWEDFGQSLSTLHKLTGESYGLDFDNYIGSLPQRNKRSNDWITFFINERLNPQLQLAIKNGKVKNSLANDFESLYKKLPHILHIEKPSLLHGDLWSGNVMVNNEGFVSLVDPAVYFGNREAEIAFTKLFGGFDEAFYESYMENFPFEKDYEERFDIYNLYPLLVHVNLFGGEYIYDVKNALRRFA